MIIKIHILNEVKYRELYQKKTGKDWKVATLQEIFKSNMVW